MTKTLKLATAIAGFAVLVASPAYAFLGGVPGPNGAYTDQRTNACCVSDGGKSQMPGLTGFGPPKGKKGGKKGGRHGGGGAIDSDQSGHTSPGQGRE